MVANATAAATSTTILRPILRPTMTSLLPGRASGGPGVRLTSAQPRRHLRACSLPRMAAEASIDRSGRRRYALASTLGAVPAIALVAWLGAVGGTDLFRREVFANFFDAQAK